jgi:hypothetical protein
VVDDRAWEGGQLIEKTYDWFAQDKEGTVWYFGDVEDGDKDLRGLCTSGRPVALEAG